MSDLELLKLLDSLMRSAKSSASPAAAVMAAEGACGREARAELAKLSDAAAVSVLVGKLTSLSGSVLAPPIVGEAARMLRDAGRQAWVIEVGRVASAPR